MRNATFLGTQTSKVSTRVTFVLILYFVTFDRGRISYFYIQCCHGNLEISFAEVIQGLRKKDSNRNELLGILILFGPLKGLSAI